MFSLISNSANFYEREKTQIPKREKLRNYPKVREKAKLRIFLDLLQVRLEETQEKLRMVRMNSDSNV